MTTPDDEDLLRVEHHAERPSVWLGRQAAYCGTKCHCLCCRTKKRERLTKIEALTKRADEKLPLFE